MGCLFKFVYLPNLGLSAEFAICDRNLEEELSKELNLDIKGTEKPSVWELIGIRFILLPYTVGKVAAFCCFMHYNEMKRYFALSVDIQISQCL